MSPNLRGTFYSRRPLRTNYKWNLLSYEIDESIHMDRLRNSTRTVAISREILQRNEPFFWSRGESQKPKLSVKWCERADRLIQNNIDGGNWCSQSKQNLMRIWTNVFTNCSIFNMAFNCGELVYHFSNAWIIYVAFLVWWKWKPFRFLVRAFFWKICWSAEHHCKCLNGRCQL